MATSAGRGAYTMNTLYFKPMLRKAFHRKSSNSSDLIGDTTKLNAEEVKKNTGSGVMADNYKETSNWWVPDDRTGYFYPKGQEKVMENISVEPLKNPVDTINWFSSHD